MINLQTFQTNTASDFKFRERRHPQWTENFELYRDTVITNRLTQRQSVNVPLMKATIKTIRANIDNAPDLYFENLDNDKQKELFMNEYWQWALRHAEARTLGKRRLEAGASLQPQLLKLNIVNGKFYVEASTRRTSHEHTRIANPAQTSSQRELHSESAWLDEDGPSSSDG